MLLIRSLKKMNMIIILFFGYQIIERHTNLGPFPLINDIIFFFNFIHHWLYALGKDIFFF